MKRRWVALCAATACNAPDVNMIVDLPASAQSETSWIEIGAFPSVCPGATELGGGLPPSGLAARAAYAADASPIGLGKLDTAIYGFAAVARRDDCGVIAAGCRVADMTSARTVDISLDPTNDPDASACTNGLVCSNARCVPPTSTNNAGAGCSMVLVGAGPLPDAMDGGPFVTAPAIAATANGGFVIVYAEYLQADGTDRLTVQPIDSGGGSLPPVQQNVDGYCAGGLKIDAAGLAMSTSGGLAVLSNACVMSGDAGPGHMDLELFTLDATGNVSKHTTAPTGSVSVALSVHALTPAATTNQWLLAANEPGAVLLRTDGTNITPQAAPFGTAQDTAARVVRTSAATAVEVDGPAVADAGVTGMVGRVYLVSGAADPAALGNPVEQVSATITALTVLGDRAFLVTNGAGQGEDVAMRGYDLGGKTVPAVSVGFSAPKSTTLLALDAAAAQNRLFCGFEQQDSVSIAVIDGASTPNPQLLNRIDLVSDIRIPKSAHDGPIAIAATASRVAVTWVAHKDALADGDTLGGYAVFACSP
jgi:hypothetical protein